MNAVRGWGEKDKEMDFVTFLLRLGKPELLRARYANIHVQSLEKKCEDSNAYVEERSKPQTKHKDFLPVKWESPRKTLIHHVACIPI